jgi:hypothetical protein
MSAPLHVWDLADPRPVMACGLSLAHPTVAVMLSTRHAPDAETLRRTSQRICKRCRRVVGSRLSRLSSPPRGRSRGTR